MNKRKNLILVVNILLNIQFSYIKKMKALMIIKSRDTTFYSI
jgi:hypothetical protein